MARVKKREGERERKDGKEETENRKRTRRKS